MDGSEYWRCAAWPPLFGGVFAGAFLGVFCGVDDKLRFNDVQGHSAVRNLGLYYCIILLSSL